MEIPEPKSANIGQDRFDARRYGELLQVSPELQQLSREAIPGWPSMLQDIFASYFKSSPHLVPEEEISLVARCNRRFIERLLDDTTYQQTHLQTMLDHLVSGLASIETGRRLLSEIERRPELKQALSEQALSEEGENEHAQLSGLASIETGRRLRGENEHAQCLRRAIRNATTAGQDKANEIQAVLTGWGMTDAELQQLPLDERMRLAHKLLTPRMKMLADLIGRMRNLARARQKDRIQHPRDELHSIATGDNLGRLLPSELALLPRNRLEFYRRWVEKQLLQYDLKSREAQALGPMIVLVDASGSMTGDKMDQAVAVALALVDTARRQKRLAWVIFFNTKVIQETYFGKEDSGRSNCWRMMDLIAVGASGGTDYWPALERACSHIAHGLDRADIVLITDSQAQLEAHQRKVLIQSKEAWGFRVWSVLIESKDVYGELGKWSDRIWTVQSLMDAAGEVFESVGNL